MKELHILIFYYTRFFQYTCTYTMIFYFIWAKMLRFLHFWNDNQTRAFKSLSLISTSICLCNSYLYVYSYFFLLETFLLRSGCLWPQDFTCLDLLSLENVSEEIMTTVPRTAWCRRPPHRPPPAAEKPSWSPDTGSKSALNWSQRPGVYPSCARSTLHFKSVLKSYNIFH